MFAAVALVVGLSGLAPSVHAQLVEVASDDFEGLTLQPFTVDYSNPYFLDGTDWSKNFPAGWTLDNSGNTYDNTGMPGEFDGWSLLDVASWIGHAGIQVGRDRCFFGSTGRNTALVADPDEADDGGNTDLGPTDFNSYIIRTYDISAADNATLSISFDWDFVTEDSQKGVFEVSFDGGSSWQNVFTITTRIDVDDIDGDGDVTDLINGEVFSTVEGAQKTFVAGADFTADLAATQVQVRWGCIEAGNDWWFAVDNVSLDDQFGNLSFEDFERDPTLANQPFSAANIGPTEPTDPSDGSDWTRTIPNWTVINDGPADRPLKQLYRISEEGAMNGWAVLDSQSWFDQQGDQQRGFFPLLSSRNSVLIADGDFHDDRLVSTDTAGQAPPDGEFQYNSFVQRQYDMSGFDNTTVRLEFDWETRLEDSQRLVADVSFDYGQTWTTILDVDSDRLTLVDTNGDDVADSPAEPAYELELFPFLFNDNGGDGFVSGGDVLNTSAAPQLFEFGVVGADLPAGKGNSMILRFGCLDTGNDWWAAVDNVRVQAETQGFLMGDGDGDGDIDFTDLDLFAAALFGAAPYDIRFDFIPDGVINFSDLNGFAGELFLFN